MPSNYRYAGLQIVSELPIPEWTIFEQDEPFADEDVRITLRSVQTGQVLKSSEAWIAPGEYCFLVPEAAEYRVLHGREIIVTPAPNAGANELRLFLLGSAWGALCYQRGILALHMSVVQVSEHAVAFGGASGAGKSSIAAGLLARGYPLIGDDLCCFDFAAGVPRVYPSAPRLKLWRDALAHLGWYDEDLVRDHFRMDKFHVTARRGEASTETIRASSSKLAADALPVPVRAIYMLEWGDLGLTRVTGLNALRRLVASATYRAELIDPLGQTGTYWEQCAQLVHATPIWELVRPRDWAMMDAAIDLLMGNL
jgi:hypothetical protein